MYKILVFGPSWVGDAVMCQPMLQRLTQRHPDAIIDMIAPAWTAELYQAMPQVNRVITNPFPHGSLQFRQRFSMGRQLRDQHYDQAIVLPNSLKSALPIFFAGIPLRTGFVGECRYGLLNDARKLNKQALPLMVERFAHLADKPGQSLQRPVPAPELAFSTDQQRQALQQHQLTREQPVAILCPGAEYGPAKQWPTEYFARLAQQFIQQHYQVWIIGSKKDRAVADDIVQQSRSPVTNLCGSTTILEAIALLSCGDIVISNDSGLMHVAAALKRPLLALYGSSSPDFTPPLSETARILQYPVECSPCFKRHCPLEHFNCMRKLTPETVWENVAEISDSAGAAS